MTRRKRLIRSVLFWIIAIVLLLGIIQILIPQPRPTVVKIEVETMYGRGWQGSGVFIDDDLILTAGHIVKGAENIWVTWSDGRRHKAVDWYEESEADLGIIYIRTIEKEHKVKFDNAIVGEEVWALGNPFGVFPVLTKGIISAINVSDDFTRQKNMIITDCAINSGNSGSPLFDKNNNILGICSWGYTYAEGMSYFVRAEICELTLDKYYVIKALDNAK